MINKIAAVILFVIILCPSINTRQRIVEPASTIETIQTVVNNANEGDVIVIKAGVYILNDTLKIDNKKRITITGLGKVEFVLTEPTMPVISITNTQGLAIRNIQTYHKPAATGCSGFVISADRSTGIRIENCKLNGCGAVGFISWHCKNITISGCKVFNNNKHGLSFNQSSQIVIRDSRIFRNGEAGITFYQCSNIRIAASRISKNKFGISMGETTGLSVEKVKFASNTENISRF